MAKWDKSTKKADLNRLNKEDLIEIITVYDAVYKETKKANEEANSGLTEKATIEDTRTALQGVSNALSKLAFGDNIGKNPGRPVNLGMTTPNDGNPTGSSANREGGGESNKGYKLDSNA